MEVFAIDVWIGVNDLLQLGLQCQLYREGAQQ